jgi:hypothetical protein
VRKLQRLLAVIPVLFVLGWASSLAFGLLRADGLVREASAEMASWEARRAKPDPSTWSAVRERLDAAERITPGDPTLHELRGLLGSMRSDSADEITSGIAHLSRSLELRPVSPYAWANLAEAQ